MKKYNRVFVIVMDSLGVGAMEDAAEYGDAGTNTLLHISESVEQFHIPNLQKLGLANLVPLKQVEAVEQPLAYYGQGYHDRTLGDDGPGGYHAF